MRIALLGRSRMALHSGDALLSAGHSISLVATGKAAEHDDVEPGDFRRLAERAGARFTDATSVRSADGARQLREADAEIGISVNWPALLGADAIGAFPRGILNAHAGDLPRYRGNACINWAMLNREERVGLCIHQMIPGELDNGPVLLRDWFPLQPDTYVGEVVQWLEQRVPAMYVAAVRGLEQGTLIAKPQPSDPSLSLRCYPRRPADSQIDWRQAARDVECLVRASSRPFAGAYSHLEGLRKVTVWKAQVHAHEGPFVAVPGSVMLRAGDDPIIACGEGCLRLTDVSLDGETDGAVSKRTINRSLRHRLL
jgi:methionyl-tRNA formyltransferase